MSHSPAAPARTTPIRPYEVDTVELMAALPDATAEMVAQLVRERDNLFVLHEAVIRAEQAGSLETQLRVFVEAIRRVGFGRVTLSVRDAALEPTMIVSAGLTPDEELELRGRRATGAAWRRRLPQLEPFRVGQSFYLDARDPWVRREFAGGVASAFEPSEDPDWTPQDALLVPLYGGAGDLIALLTLDEPPDRRRPPLTRVRTVELFAQQVANCIERGRLAALAQERAARLQRLQEAGAAMARLLDEREVFNELARQAARLVAADDVLVAEPGADSEPPRAVVRLAVHGGDPADDAVFAAALVAAVRSGAAERAAEDRSTVLAVPLLAGRQLAGVLAVRSAVPGFPSPDDEDALLTLGALAATAVANAHRYEESERERRQSEALADVARAVSESLRLGEVLRLILRHAVALLGGGGAAVGLRRDDYIHVLAGVGDAQLLGGSLLPIHASVAGAVVLAGRSMIVNDAPASTAMYRPAVRIANVGKLVYVPLVSGGEAIGVLTVVNRAADFTDADARVLQRLADHVTVAIVNARLFEEADASRREWVVAFDAVSTGMVVLDDGGRVTRANARAAALLGAPDAAALAGAVFRERLLGEVEAVDPSAAGLVAAHEHGGDAVLAALAGVSTRSTVRAGGRLFDVIAAPHPSGGAVVTFDDVTTVHALAERHRSVVETTRDAIVIADVERRLTFANPAAERLFGTDELVGRTLESLMTPECAAVARDHETLALAGEPQRYDCDVARADGERRAVSASAAPLREVGGVSGVVVSMRDVTDERRARDAVAYSEARYRNLFETATDAIYTIDAEGRFATVNEATCRASGLAREALLGRLVAPLLLAEERPRVRDAFLSALAGEAVRYECTLVRLDGVRRLLSVSNTPIRSGSAVVGVLGVARDVTDERLRAAALERSEARYTRLVESAADAICTVDAEGRFTDVNKALQHALGRPRDALVGAAFIGFVDERDRALMDELFARTMAGGRGRGEMRFAGADGAVRTATVLTSPAVEHGAVTGVLAVVRDVTEERRLTEQMLQQEKLAAVGQLVSGVAHELNNPLAGVMAFSQLLLMNASLDADSAQYAETINAEARRAAKIVGNLLTFARRHHPERALTDLNQVALDTLELRRYALRVSQIELDVDLDPALPCTWADPFQLQQVMLNLLANAEQALTDWTGERRMALRTSVSDGTITLTVSDTGPGVAPAAMPRVFNPFYTTKPVGQGTGLGLSISDGIVREHGGRIRVVSEPGAGAAFVVELPVVEPPPLEPAPARRADGGAA